MNIAIKWISVILYLSFSRADKAIAEKEYIVFSITTVYNYVRQLSWKAPKKRK